MKVFNLAACLKKFESHQLLSVKCAIYYSVNGCDEELLMSFVLFHFIWGSEINCNTPKVESSVALTIVLVENIMLDFKFSFPIRKHPPFIIYSFYILYCLFWQWWILMIAVWLDGYHCFRWTHYVNLKQATCSGGMFLHTSTHHQIVWCHNAEAHSVSVFCVESEVMKWAVLERNSSFGVGPPCVW